jgi:hypothetical protein
MLPAPRRRNTVEGIHLVLLDMTFDAATSAY